MKSLEQTPRSKENKETRPSLVSLVDKLQTSAEDRSASTESAIQAAQRALRGTEQAHDLDGAVVDLRAANRHLHTELLTTLGQQAERARPDEAQTLVARGRDLLAVQERFAEAT